MHTAKNDKSTPDTAQDALFQIYQESKQIMEVAQFREAFAFDQSQRSNEIADRWKRDMIEELEQGNEGDPVPSPEEFRKELSRRVFQEMLLLTHMQNASALVMCHSFFDSLLTDLLKVTVMADKSCWLGYVSNRKVSIEDVTNKGLDSATDDAIAAACKEMEFQSVVKRTQMLTGLCRLKWESHIDAPFEFVHMPNFQYSEEHLAEIDRLRQDIIHNKGMYNDIQAIVEENCVYLWQCLYNFILLTSISFGIPLSVDGHFRTRFSTRRWTLTIGKGILKLDS